MVTSSLHVVIAGVELGYSYKLPGSHIPCMGIAFLHVLLADVEWDHNCKRNISYPGANWCGESLAYP